MCDRGEVPPLFFPKGTLRSPIPGLARKAALDGVSLELQLPLSWPEMNKELEPPTPAQMCERLVGCPERLHGLEAAASRPELQIRGMSMG